MLLVFGPSTPDAGAGTDPKLVGIGTVATGSAGGAESQGAGGALGGLFGGVGRAVGALAGGLEANESSTTLLRSDSFPEAVSQ